MQGGSTASQRRSSRSSPSPREMAALDGKTLAQLARIAQKEQLAGARGSWKDFLQSKVRKKGCLCTAI